jgi:hypothetical protein
MGNQPVEGYHQEGDQFFHVGEDYDRSAWDRRMGLQDQAIDLNKRDWLGARQDLEGHKEKIWRTVGGELAQAYGAAGQTAMGTGRLAGSAMASRRVTDWGAQAEAQGRQRMRDKEGAYIEAQAQKTTEADYLADKYIFYQNEIRNYIAGQEGDWDKGTRNDVANMIESYYWIERNRGAPAQLLAWLKAAAHKARSSANSGPNMPLPSLGAVGVSRDLAEQGVIAEGRNGRHIYTQGVEKPSWVYDKAWYKPWTW